MNKTALVTGGTGGLGSAVTKRLLDDGWRVVVPWIVEAELERIGEHPRLEPIRADLFAPRDVTEVAQLAGGNPEAPLGAVANLVGGFAMAGKLHETSIDEFDRMLRLNLRPTYLVTQAALPYMIEAGGGSIVAVSTKAAFAPFAGASAYVTSKAAVWALIMSISVEYAGEGIRANAILPTVIDTPGNRESQPDSARTNWTSPTEIADTIAYLFSDSSAAVTGAQIPVPGVKR
ncbi:SDR family NAD(P)-dependent oxidoreductase [Rhodococcus sp. 14C212]|uniref:SDR family NAD(P)-dependent oxidoreductase n=1 Tax=Rhodococcus sp. 14C212 TaxID=2711209 RepID=UPI0013ED2907|nr:SDR family NAD(P)-dependent oxidoreductase [Rhodococcus sp. 14C212]NGP06769.1 SDR family NAD(P)-dependent oxidoreductase [Rhodococcus sp. 14C212]